jgi:hypothetical protein
MENQNKDYDYSLNGFNKFYEKYDVSNEERIKNLNIHLEMIDFMVFPNKNNKEFSNILKKNRKEIMDELNKCKKNNEKTIKKEHVIINDLKINGIEFIEKDEFDFISNPLSIEMIGITDYLNIKLVSIQNKYFKILKDKVDNIFFILINDLIDHEMANYIHKESWIIINNEFQKSDRKTETLYNILVDIMLKYCQSNNKSNNKKNDNKKNDNNKNDVKIIKQNVNVKKKIPVTLKRKVWSKWIGEDIGKTKCFCCKLTDITQLSFSCGHIISEFNGGELKLDNLQPICVSCNSSMGINNMDEFIKNYGF